MSFSEGFALKKLLINRARSCIGRSLYRGDARPEEAPAIFNCFRFTWWVWRPCGIELPDHQLICPWLEVVSVGAIEIADLVFVPRLNRGLHTDDFGHVGIATDECTVIHATNRRHDERRSNGVIEESLQKFLARGCLGVRRVPPALITTAVC
jgi:cell wall-associated NlpC family hydrolase